MEHQPDHNMPAQAPGHSGIKARLQQWVRKNVWKMDIHPSARISQSALIDRTFPKGVHIAENCVIDHEAVVLTHDLTRGLYLNTRVGSGTYVGPRSIILPGISIGANCNIAAGALVNRDMPDNSEAVGNPAKISVRDKAQAVPA